MIDQITVDVDYGDGLTATTIEYAYTPYQPATMEEPSIDEDIEIISVTVGGNDASWLRKETTWEEYVKETINETI